MIVITLTNCPQALRGEITLWFQEISNGVFVGKVNARVRDNIWERIVKNIKNGQATMSYNTNNEQGYISRVHNTAQAIINYDGLNLVLWPNRHYEESNINIKEGFSKAAKMQKAREFTNKKLLNKHNVEYIILDVETTGLNPMQDSIIQIAALYIVNDEIVNTFNEYIAIDFPIPTKIVRLTGIDDSILKEKGKDELEVLSKLLNFIKNKTIVGHNIGFDISFLLMANKRLNLPEVNNKLIDTLELSKKNFPYSPSFKLSSLAKHLGCNLTESHTAHGDCHITKFLYEQLIKKAN